MAGSTTPTGRSLAESNWKYALSSFSVRTVRWCFCTLMASIFCWNSAASCFDGGAPVPDRTTSAPAQSSATAMRCFACTLPKIVLPLAIRIVRAIGLARARDELELAPLHLLFEEAELRLLQHVEHLIDGLIRLARVGGGAVVDVFQQLDRSLELLLVQFGVVDGLSQLIQHPSALLQSPAPRVLQRFESRQKPRELVVVHLQETLRLQERPRIEQLLELGRRDRGISSRRRLRALPTLLRARQTRRRNQEQSDQ